MEQGLVDLSVSAEAAAFVRPVAFVVAEVAVREGDQSIEASLHGAAAASRASGGPADVIAAVRAMYRQFGVDPTRTRPSSEALLRRVRKGDELPRVNNLVDVINWCSLESQLPFGLYDCDRVEGPVSMRLGRDGESYAGIRKDDVHVAGRLTIVDAIGPFGNPTSDSARTMVTVKTRKALVVVFVPLEVAAAYVERTAALTRERIGRFCR